MPRSDVRYTLPSDAPPSVVRKDAIEYGFIGRLQGLKYDYRRAMEQIASSKNDPGNGYTCTLLCFLQLFIVSNRDRTYDAANNNARHFAFNAVTSRLTISSNSLN